MGTTTLWIVVAVVVVLVLILVGFLAARRNRERRREERRERSRREFGPEYERAARERGSEEEGERELRRRRGSVEKRIEPLSEESRVRYEERWGEVERVFVDNPERSIEMADRAISDVLHERNFVTDAAQPEEETEKNLAATHPDVADDYREARRIRAAAVARSAGGDAEEVSTEDLRRAIRKYRAVYQRLVKQ